VITSLWLAVCTEGLADEEEGYLQLYDGYGTPEKVVVRGRLLEEKPPPVPEKKGSVPGNVIRTVELLETDEIAGAPVEVRSQGRKARGVTDKEGFFKLSLRAVGSPWPQGEVPIDVRARTPEGKVVRARGTALVYPPGPVRIVVTDFDDTLARTKVARKLRLAWKTLAGDPSRIKPVEGMAHFLDQLCAEQPAAVVYLSAAPVNLYPRLKAFLDREGFPRGPLLLRNIGLGRANDPWSALDYKVSHLEQIRRTFPEGRFVLIGDSGERDPEAYRIRRDRHPESVEAIFIRTVEKRGGDEADRFRRILTFRTGKQALAAAKKERICVPDGNQKETRESDK
jgi:phosphatidate phosphatase APP1